MNRVEKFKRNGGNKIDCTYRLNGCGRVREKAVLKMTPWFLNCRTEGMPVLFTVERTQTKHKTHQTLLQTLFYLNLMGVDRTIVCILPHIYWLS